MPELFDILSGAENRDARAALVTLIRQNGAVAFVGAGASMAAGYPGWDGLIVTLQTLCESVGGFVKDDLVARQDPLVYADRMKAHLLIATGSNERYEAHLFNAFMKSPRIDQFHRDLVGLPFRGFVTPNYEYTVETALAIDEREPAEKAVIIGHDHDRLAREFLLSLPRVGDPRQVAHIHGDYRHPGSIILAGSEYSRAYGLAEPAGEPTILVTFLNALLAQWSIVFVGFSFRDLQLEILLGTIGRRFKLWNAGVHYAIMPTSADTLRTDVDLAKRLSGFGICTVFYEQIGASHEKLNELMAIIATELGVRRAPTLADINKRMAEDMRG